MKEKYYVYLSTTVHQQIGERVFDCQVATISSIKMPHFILPLTHVKKSFVH